MAIGSSATRIRLGELMNDLQALLERLQAAPRDLLATAAKSGGLPSEKALRKIADLGDS